jgi:ankyrin repeat protein
MTWTKLHEACERHAMEGDNVLKLLEKCKDDILSVNEHGSTALHLLCWGNPNPKFVEALLHYSPQAASAQDLNGNTPLHVACACSSTDKHLVQILLSSFPPAVSVVNCEGLMPLHMACRYASQNEPVIGLLLEQYPYALRSPIKVCDAMLLARCQFIHLSLCCTVLSLGCVDGKPGPESKKVAGWEAN